MRWLRGQAFALGMALLAVMSVTGVVLALTHPDMTQTRLLITYWPITGGMAAGLLLVMWGADGWR